MPVFESNLNFHLLCSGASNQHLQDLDSPLITHTKVLHIRNHENAPKAT